MARRTGRARTIVAPAQLPLPPNVMPLRMADSGPVPVGRDVAPPTVNRWTPTQYGEITLPQALAVEKLAERGQTMQWVDLTRRMLRSDDHLLAVYESRIDAVAGAHYAVKSPPHVDAARDDIAKRAADDCAWALSRLPFENIASHLLDAVFTGYAVAEIIWDVVGGVVVPVEVLLHHPRRFQFADDFSLYVYDPGMPTGDDKGQRAPMALGPSLARDKFLVHMPRTLPDYPTAGGLFHAMLRPWWVKIWCTKFWLGGAEVAGNPRLLGKYPQDADQATKNALAAAIQSLSADAHGVVPVTNSLEYLAPAGNVGSVWEGLCGRCDAAMSKLALGSTLNTEIDKSGGNRAAAESQDATTIVPRLERDARMMWSTIERGLFEPFLRFNPQRYGGQMPPVPRGQSEISRERPTVQMIEALAKHGACTVDELRTFATLEMWGPEKGGDAKVAAEVGAAPAAAPAVGAQVVGDAADVAATAFNGAQVTSLQGVLAAIKAGELSPEAAVIAIGIAFPNVSREQATAMAQAQAKLVSAPVAAPTASAPPAAPPSATSSPVGGGAAALPFDSQ